MNFVRRLAAFFLTPALFGIVAAIPYYIGYRFYDVHAQLEPAAFEFVELGIALVAGALCAYLAIKIIDGKPKIVGVFLAIPALAFGALKCLMFQSEVLSFVGFGCCRESDTTLMRLAEFAFSPLSPFFLVANYVS